MAHLYFVRHGQTVWNVENKICGATDSPLTELGHQQARDTAREVQRLGIHVDEILYSPLSRAADTAREIAQVTGIPARPEQRLIEQSFGVWESTPRDGKDFHEAKKNFASRYGDGESMLQVAHRVYSLLDDLQKEPEKTYMLVAHNGIARVIQSYFFDMTNEEFAGFGVKNCAVVKYEFPEQEVR